MSADTDSDAIDRQQSDFDRLRTLLVDGVGIRSIALTIIGILFVLYTLYFARPVILPVVLAVIISMLLAPVVRALHQRFRLPPPVGAGMVLLSFCAVVVIGAVTAIPPAMAWMQTVPSRLPEIKQRLEFLQVPFARVSEASEQMKELTSVAKSDSDEKPVVQVEEDDPFEGLLFRHTPAFVANLVFMVILLYFLLGSGDIFLRKLVRMVRRFEDKRRTVEIAREVEDKISNYLRTITLINLGLGISVGIAAMIVGLPQPFLWGILAGVLNYVPYLGAIIGITSTAVVGLLSFESTSHAFAMPIIYFVLNAVEGNFITPFIMSRILTLNPVIVFISLMFWSWLWGIPGALLAVPILAIFKIVCDHISPLTPLGEFIGGDPEAAGTTS